MDREIALSVKYNDGRLFFLNQTLLPEKEEYVEITNETEAWTAIKRLVLRGAPAIGVGAAYALSVCADHLETEEVSSFCKEVHRIKEYLNSSRPTAVNLSWALNRMENRMLSGNKESTAELKAVLREEAEAIYNEDVMLCRKIGEAGQEIMKDGMGILTHCNAGALATSRYGTALSPIYVAQERGLNVRVFADETRPLLQGSRLTAYELTRAGVDTTVITDSMAAVVMKKGWVDAVIVRADRIAANGDAANKIGTYGVALLAKAHNIPFYVACPYSTVDMNTPSGEDIVIEERAAEEVLCGMGKQTGPKEAKVFNPAFDVTPHELIAGIITEKGILRAPYNESLRKLDCR